MVSHLQTFGPGKAKMQFENLRADVQIPGYVWSTINQEWHRSAQADGSSFTFFLTFCSVLAFKRLMMLTNTGEGQILYSVSSFKHNFLNKQDTVQNIA